MGLNQWKSYIYQDYALPHFELYRNPYGENNFPSYLYEYLNEWVPGKYDASPP